MASLTDKTVKGSAWMIAMRLTVNLLGLCSTVILARLLTPQDFGLVALAGSAYTFFNMFGQFGFDIPLIQLKDPDRLHYDTAWTAHILVGLFVATAMFAVAKPAASYFQDSRLEYIIYSFSLLSLAKGFENIGVVNFRKRLAFRGEFLYFVVPKMTSLVVGVTAALLLRNYWALVIGMISAQVAGLLYSHLSQSFRPRLSLTKLAELFRSGKWILASKMLRYVTFNGMEVIVGRLRGPEAVGLFTISRQISFLPSTEISAPINRALFPGFATISEETARLRSAFGKVVGITALLSVPAAFGFMAISDSLVHVVLGEKWWGAAPVLGVLAPVGAFYAVSNLVEPILLARGMIKTLVYAQAGYAAMLVPAAILLGSSLGTIGVAYALLGSTLAAVPLFFGAAKKAIGFGMADLARCFWRPLIAAGVMMLAIKSAETALLAGGEKPNVLELLSLILTGTIVYGGALSLLWLLSRKPASPELILIELVSSRLRSRNRN